MLQHCQQVLLLLVSSKEAFFTAQRQACTFEWLPLLHMLVQVAAVLWELHLAFRTGQPACANGILVGSLRAWEAR